MSSIFPYDPVSFSFSSLVILPNLRYGRRHSAMRLNYYRNPIRIGVSSAFPNGRNPVNIFTHGGALIGYEKTDQPINGRVSTWHFRYGLATQLWRDYGGGTVPFDFASVMTPQWSYAFSNQPDYEPQMDNPPLVPPTYPNGGFGGASVQPYGIGFPDDVQAAWQWVDDNAIMLGCDPDRKTASGYSYGAFASSVAALRDSRQYGPGCEYQSEAKVKMVLNYSGEISMSPELIEHTTTRYLFGITSSDNSYASTTGARAQMNKLLLIPKPDGSYDSTCDRTALCKAISPMDLIDVASSAKRLVRFRHYYDSQDTTAAPILGYPAVPPWDQSGHDCAQAPIYHNKLVDAGFTSAYALYDSGIGIQAAMEPTLRDTYNDMVAAVS